MVLWVGGSCDRPMKKPCRECIPHSPHSSRNASTNCRAAMAQIYLYHPPRQKARAQRHPSQQQCPRTHLLPTVQTRITRNTHQSSDKEKTATFPNTRASNSQNTVTFPTRFPPPRTSSASPRLSSTASATVSKSAPGIISGTTARIAL